MNIVFYVIIFIIGTLLGRFNATTIKRILKGKKVFSTHSYCANCGQKLNFFEKIPILSYIILKGKCKHCKKKIDAQYIILESITGILLLVVAYCLNIKIFNLNPTNLISFIAIILYFSYIILTIGIDKENKSMSPSVLAYGIIISLIYIVYLYIVEKTSIYINTLHLLIMIFLLILNIITTKKRAQGSYVIDTLTMLLIMSIFTGEQVSILTVIGTLLSIALYILIKKINELKIKGKKSKNTFGTEIKIIFIMGILNIITFLTILIISK